jgi:hypothetical protein
MSLTSTTAKDLGYLLHKNPFRGRAFALAEAVKFRAAGSALPGSRCHRLERGRDEIADREMR